MSLSECHLIELPKITDPRGSLTFVEAEKHIPFNIRRIYYLYDIPNQTNRGGHAHKALFQLMIALSGSFNVTLDDGFDVKTFTLNSPNMGLIITPMIWRELNNFSSGSVCFVAASELYSEDDYFRDYATFRFATQEKK